MVTVGRNSTGATLYKGTIVYISGSTGNRPNFVKSQANAESTSAGTFGVIENDIPNNSDGNCVTIGTIENLDTRSTATHPFTNDTLLDGDTIYLSPTTAGFVTKVKPSAPNHMVYVGKVVRTSPTNGTIVYRIQNGYELDEIHDVTTTNYSTPQDVDSLLILDNSTSLWKRLTWANLKATAKTYFDTLYQSILVSGTNIKTINGSSVLGSGNLTISGGITSVTGTAPISSSGGATPEISIATANTTTTGALTSTDWNAFNGKQSALGFTPENVANKSVSVVADKASDTKYPSVKSVWDWVVSAFQPLLVSGTSIKTINGSSVLGSGDLVVGGGGGNVIPAPPITGLYYMTTACMNFADGHNLWANELTFNPFRPMNNFNVNQFNIEVTQLFAGANARVVIYSDLNGKPSSKLYESTNIDISTTGYKTVTMSYSFVAGTLYWIGIQGSLNGGRLRSVLATNTMLAWSVGATSSNAYSTLIYTSLAFGSLPATIPPATAIFQGSAGPFVLKFRSA